MNKGYYSPVKKESMLEVYAAIALLLIIYIGYIGHTLHTQFKVLGELEKQFIELQNIQIPEIPEDIEIRG